MMNTRDDLHKAPTVGLVGMVGFRRCPRAVQRVQRDTGGKFRARCMRAALVIIHRSLAKNQLPAGQGALEGNMVSFLGAADLVGQHLEATGTVVTTHNAG